jgi:hypothetical protein
MRNGIDRVAMKNISVTEVVSLEHAASRHADWDAHELLQRLDNDHTFLCELLAAYRQDSQTSLRAAKNALASQDLARWNELRTA